MVRGKILVITIAALGLSACKLTFTLPQTSTASSSGEGGFSTSFESSSIPSGEESSAATTPSVPSTVSVESSSEKSSSASSSSDDWIDDGYYRIGRVLAANDQCVIYNLDGSVYKTLAKSVESDMTTWYCDKLEVAAYYQAFGELPVNYVFNDDSDTDGSRALALSNFGTYGRMYSKYYTRTNGYTRCMPAPNYNRYFEIDIAAKGNTSYNNGSRISRGAERLVAFPQGMAQYGSESVLFYTDDHYETFREYLNYAKRRQNGSIEGFGSSFGLVSSGYDAYVRPTTISL